MRVLAAFLSEPSDAQYGLDIAERLSIKSGTLYPILGRLERAGWLTSELEDGDPKVLARPRRRLYRLTGLGEESARAGLRQHVADLSVAAAEPRRRHLLQPRAART